MTTQPALRPATYADIEALPPHVTGEILDDVLYTHPRPACPHALAASSLGIELGGPFQKGRGGPGGWWILFEAELHLGRDVLVPDLAGWRRERMPGVPRTAAIELVPDWVCEVLSPSTEDYDRGEKMRRYGRHGVGHLWLVDPLAFTLEAYANAAGIFRPLGGWRRDAVASIAPFEALALELRVLWE